jgi:hypothetical protein
MISTCPGIDKYAFYLDFKGVLSSKPQASVPKPAWTRQFFILDKAIHHFQGYFQIYTDEIANSAGQDQAGLGV